MWPIIITTVAPTIIIVLPESSPPLQVCINDPVWLVSHIPPLVVALPVLVAAVQGLGLVVDGSVVAVFTLPHDKRCIAGAGIQAYKPAINKTSITFNHAQS